MGGIAIDASGNAYVAGFTSNAQNGFPTKNALQTAYGGDPSDAFLMMIFPGGQGAADMIYATLLGGSGLDEALAVAVDNSIPANAYVTGTTQSANFPTNGTMAPYQSHLHVNATANAFLSVVAQNPATGMTSLAYSTYLGGSAMDAGQGVTATAFNSVYITGAAKSWDFPWHDNLQPFNGSSDGFIAKLDTSAAGTAGASCSIGVVFSPKAIGTFHAQITITDNSGGVINATQVVSLTGTATSVAPVASVTPATLAFGDIVAGTSSGAQQVNISSAGSAALNIAGIAITGANAADFAMVSSGANQCPTSGSLLAIGASCAVGVRFAPPAGDSTGAKSAVLRIPDNVTGSPQTVMVSGIATVPPTIQISPASLTFAPQSVGIPSPAQTLTLLNGSGGPLSINGISITGANAADFSQTNNCPPSLRAAASCAVSVMFLPALRASANRAASVSIADNAGGSPQIVSLTGSAT